jgi:outer membrane protein OmpA-like peptidoglycan-associated protein
MKYLILILLFIAVRLNASDTLKLYYNINISSLGKDKVYKLNQAIKNKNVSQVEVLGYADYIGTDERNQILSQKRADKVKSYFESKKIPVVSSIGKGMVGAVLKHSKGIQENRRVDVILHYNSIVKTSEIKPNSDSLQKEILNLEVGDKIVLKNFNFIPGRHFLVLESKPELTRLIDIMIKNPTLKIELHGHICCEVDHDDGWDIDAMNYSLSLNRAKYIYQQLLKFGVSGDRMSYKGFGRTTPLYPLELDENQKNANRRVEIQIVEK